MRRRQRHTGGHGNAKHDSIARINSRRTMRMCMPQPTASAACAALHGRQARVYSPSCCCRMGCQCGAHELVEHSRIMGHMLFHTTHFALAHARGLCGAVCVCVCVRERERERAARIRRNQTLANQILSDTPTTARPTLLAHDVQSSCGGVCAHSVWCMHMRVARLLLVAVGCFRPHNIVPCQV